MEAADTEERWKNQKIKEEILSEDENIDDRAINETIDKNELNEIYSGGGYCCFIKEETSHLDFKEEVDDESCNISYDESNTLLEDPVKIEQNEYQDVVQIIEEENSITQPYVYLNENNETIPNVNQKSLRKKSRKNNYTSLFSYPTNGEDIARENTNHQMSNQSEEVPVVLKNKEPKVEFSCSECGRNYKCYIALQIHKCDGKKCFECATCGRKFSSKGYLILHIKRHTNNAQFRCTFCGKSFIQRCRLVMHERQHTGEKPYKCDECGMTFALKTYLSSHMIKHSTERPFSCNVCNMSFKYKSVMKKHMTIHMDDEYKIKSSFDCKICSKSFKRKIHLQKHVRAHAYQQYSFVLCKNIRTC